MNKFIKGILITGTIISVIGGIAYYSFLQVDFIGYKDPKIIEENLKRWNSTLLSAEFRDGTDYCKVNLLDSITIEINVGDKSGGTTFNEEYKLSKDTIVIMGGIIHANKYLNNNKFLIQNNKLLFKVDHTGSFDTVKVMNISFNKIKQ